MILKPVLNKTLQQSYVGTMLHDNSLRAGSLREKNEEKARTKEARLLFIFSRGEPASRLA